MRRSSLLIVLSAFLLPSFLLAQQPGGRPQLREGFWISLGVGAGPKSLDCEALCTSEFGRGTGGNLALGGTIDERWLVGADLVGWFPWAGAGEGYDDDTDGFGAALFTARFYPRAERGLFVSGGLGIGTVDVQQDQLEATGYVAQLGGGYDLRVGRTFSFTPFVSLVRTFDMEASIAGETVPGDVGFGMALLGVALTWH